MAFLATLREIVDSVSDALGPGFSESIYHNAILVELRLRNLQYESERIIPVSYKGHTIGNVRADIIVNNKIILELKSIANIRQCDKTQCEMYSRLLGIKEVYLINFSLKNAEIVLLN